MKKETQYQKPAPGIFFGNYPERKITEDTFFPALKKKLMMPFVRLGRANSNIYPAFIKQVADNEQKLRHLSGSSLTDHVTTLRASLTMHGLTEPLIADVFAIISHASTLALGIKPYHTQLIAARTMLDGSLAEMATGEGKTIAAAICAATAAMAGIPVHLITSNDYLVVRDAEKMLPLYQLLGLTVGTITQPLNAEGRIAAYRCNITYTTAKELVFDYLKDRTIRGSTHSSLHQRVATLSDKENQTLLRGLCMAVIDEADSIMIDEATVPLILSQGIERNNAEHHYYQQALRLALTLTHKDEFLLNHQQLSVELTDLGREKIKAATNALQGVWQNRLHREEVICQALAAQHLYQANQQYIVKDDKIHIIDEVTGRLAAGRVWSRGLHQLIEIKESCQPSNELMTVAQITYQRFFPRYLKLGGMSGTLSESRIEFFSIYGLRINKVPLKKISQRITLPPIIYANQQQLWRETVTHVKSMHQTGRPILIGTDSVADSEALSSKLQQAGLEHNVLNARQDQQEASIVSQAGQKNQITISTNMAGRGTDIALPQEVIDLGGIHLISCQHNSSRRIDRQLIGRCARHGHPGSTITLLSLDKPLIKKVIPKLLTKKNKPKSWSYPSWLINFIICLPQWLEESNQFKKRQTMMKRDARFEKETLLPN